MGVSGVGMPGVDVGRMGVAGVRMGIGTVSGGCGVEMGPVNVRFVGVAFVRVPLVEALFRFGMRRGLPFVVVFEEPSPECGQEEGHRHEEGDSAGRGAAHIVEPMFPGTGKGIRSIRSYRNYLYHRIRVRQIRRARQVCQIRRVRRVCWNRRNCRIGRSRRAGCADPGSTLRREGRHLVAVELQIVGLLFRKGPGPA